MKFYTALFSTAISLLFFVTSSAQTISATGNKEAPKTEKPIRLKNETIYRIIIPAKDPFNFDSGRTITGKQNDLLILILSSLNNKSFQIEFSDSAMLLMSLNLTIAKQKSDTKPVYSIHDPTFVHHKRF